MRSLIATFNGLIGIRIRYFREVLLFREGLRLGRSILHKLEWHEDDDFSKFLLVSIARVTHRMEVLYLLCVRGYGKDAVLILRAIFEELVEMKFLAKDKKRTADVIAYDDYLRLKLGGNIVRSGYQKYDKEEFDKHSNELRARWSKIEHRFKYANGKVYRHWSGLSVADMAKAVDLDKAYESLYPYASQFTHSTSLSANDFMIGRDLKKNTVVLELGASNAYVEESLITALMMYTDLLSLADEHQKLNQDARIKKFADKIMKVGKIPEPAPAKP